MRQFERSLSSNVYSATEYFDGSLQIRTVITYDVEHVLKSMLVFQMVHLADKSYANDVEYFQFSCILRFISFNEYFRSISSLEYHVT
jgi:hypothetical protein